MTEIIRKYIADKREKKSKDNDGIEFVYPSLEDKAQTGDEKANEAATRSSTINADGSKPGQGKSKETDEDFKNLARSDIKLIKLRTLYWAASWGQSEIAKTLILLGISPFEKCRNDEYLLLVTPK
jgi:hypothetical protein